MTALLRRGGNALAFMAGKGQYAGGSPSFVAQLDVTYTDGSRAAFGTGPSWRTTAGPVTGEDFYDGETTTPGAPSPAGTPRASTTPAGARWTPSRPPRTR